MLVFHIILVKIRFVVSFSHSLQYTRYWCYRRKCPTWLCAPQVLIHIFSTEHLICQCCRTLLYYLSWSLKWVILMFKIEPCVLGIVEAVVRGLCKVIHLTLLRYRDSWSKGLVRGLISALATHHPDWTIKHLVPILSDIGSTYSNIVATYVSNKLVNSWDILVVYCSDLHLYYNRVQPRL